MGLSDRLYNLAKSYLEAARSRWDEIDSASQQELNDALAAPGQAPWDRAQNRITSAQTSYQADRELRQALNQPQQQFFERDPAQPIKQVQPTQPTPAPIAPQQASPNALEGAYRVLNVPVGSDLATVQKAYQDLLTKADPTKFPAGSKDNQLAHDIQRKINAAYMVLANSLCKPSDDRFDRLEL